MRGLGRALMILGALVVAGALALFVADSLSARCLAEADARAVVALSAAAEEAGGKGAPTSGSMPELVVDGSSYVGVLRVPTRGIELPVSVDMRRGSAYDGDLVIYVSGDASRALKAGDSVELTDTLGNRLAYEVDGWETVDAASADALGGGPWPLTLATPGEGDVLLAARCSLTP